MISLTKPKERKKNSCKKTAPSKEQEEKPQEQELERDIIAKIKAAEKVALQMIKISLEEAQSDKAELGRPLTFIVHDGHHLSLLSAGKKEEKAPPKKADASVQLIGMVNLLGLLLIALLRKQPMQMPKPTRTRTCSWPAALVIVACAAAWRKGQGRGVVSEHRQPL